MNKDLVLKAINDYEEIAYKELMNDINIAIKEAKEKELNPIETYKHIKEKLEESEQTLSNLFGTTNDTPLSDYTLSRIYDYLDTYLQDATKYAKRKTLELINNLNDEEYIEFYEKNKKQTFESIFYIYLKF